MKKPYIICHMMTSVDGRIDCAMTEHLPGVQEYYDTLDSLNTPTRVSGRVTAELELAGPGVFHSETVTPFGREGFSKKAAAAGYEIIADTKGTLLWEVPEGERPLLILTSQQVSQEYLAYLDAQNISWIACGETKIDLPRACEILAEQFGVERMAVVGGGHINAGFLAADLLDEVSVLIGAGIDGRGGMPAVFDGLPMERPVTELKLNSVRQYGSGAVWLRYAVKKLNTEGNSIKYQNQDAFEKANMFGTGTPNTAYAQYFIGNSFLNPLTDPKGSLFAANVTFEPGCRNNWHIHHAEKGGGQLLLCTAGEGWYQEAGKPAVSLTTGSVVMIPAEVKHWHGAKKDSWFSHIAVEVPGEGCRNEWCEPVTDEKYEKL